MSIKQMSGQLLRSISPTRTLYDLQRMRARDLDEASTANCTLDVFAGQRLDQNERELMDLAAGHTQPPRR